MELVLNRHPSTANATIGDLFVDAEFTCYVCEDVVRPPGEKVYGKTAIPAGRYRIIITRSNRFSRLAGYDVFLPLLLEVPDFQGVRIHSGNKPEDTDGCLLPGMRISASGEAVERSMVAFNILLAKIQDVLDRSEEVWITINNPVEPLREAA